MIHAASLVIMDDYACSQSKSIKINIGGTENIISGSIEAGVKGLVYTSSEAVLKGWERNKFNIDESKPYPGNDASYFSSGYYGFTKMEAEKPSDRSKRLSSAKWRKAGDMFFAADGFIW